MEGKLYIINIVIFLCDLPSFFAICPPPPNMSIRCQYLAITSPLTTLNHNGILQMLQIKETFWFVCVGFDVIPFSLSFFAFISLFFSNDWCQVCAKILYSNVLFVSRTAYVEIHKFPNGREIVGKRCGKKNRRELSNRNHFVQWVEHSANRNARNFLRFLFFLFAN